MAAVAPNGHILECVELLMTIEYETRHRVKLEEVLVSLLLNFVQTWSFGCIFFTLLTTSTLDILMALPESGPASADMPWFQFQQKFHEPEVRVLNAIGNTAVLLGAVLILRRFSRVGSIILLCGLIVSLATTLWHIFIVHMWAGELSDKINYLSLINGGPIGLAVLSALAGFALGESVCKRRSLG